MEPISSTAFAESPLRRAAAGIESVAALDGPAKAAGKVYARALRSGRIKDLLSGSWLGHALHPILTDVVIGSFTSASMLDLLGGDDDAAQRLIALGIASYAPTALSGVSDWSDHQETEPGIRRVGLVHAAGNAFALSLYTASLIARRGGDHRRGKLLALGGAAAMGAAGYLGGHMTLVQGVGVEDAAERQRA